MAGTVSAAAPSLRRADIRKLVQGDISPSVAKALLCFCNGDVEDACNLAPKAKKYIDALLCSASQPEVAAAPGASGSTDVAAANKAAHGVEELERVCTRFEDGGIPLERLVRVERVQNWRLWTRYVDRQVRTEILGVRRAENLAPEERYLWCGLSTHDLDKVIVKGFSALASSGKGTTVFVANAAVAVDQAVEARREMQGQEVHQAVDPTHPEAAVAAAEGGQAETAPAPVVGQARHAAGVGDRPLRMWSMFPRLFGSVRAQQSLSEGTGEEPATSSAVASAASAQVPAAPLPDRSASGSSQPAAMEAPGRRTSPDFPGKGGALLLCRVMLGNMAIGGSDDNADSVLDTAVVAASMERRAAAGPARVPRAVPAAAADPAWDVCKVYADDLAVSLRCAAMQAYPEYIVHFD
ncbi:hypothetical protein PLESTF_000606700 [Pleodorina starrii]|nr:hypothetical protein PLESTF_000606700 [Pleodorina starrii]